MYLTYPIVSPSLIDCKGWFFLTLNHCSYTFRHTIVYTNEFCFAQIHNFWSTQKHGQLLLCRPKAVWQIIYCTRWLYKVDESPHFARLGFLSIVVTVRSPTIKAYNLLKIKWTLLPLSYNTELTYLWNNYYEKISITDMMLNFLLMVLLEIYPFHVIVQPCHLLRTYRFIYNFKLIHKSQNVYCAILNETIFYRTKSYPSSLILFICYIYVCSLITTWAKFYLGWAT